MKLDIEETMKITFSDLVRSKVVDGLMIPNFGINYGKTNQFYIEPAFWEELWSKGILSSKGDSKALAEHWVEATQKGSGWNKYSIYMYSPSIERLREQDMGEFYGRGVVD